MTSRLLSRKVRANGLFESYRSTFFAPTAKLTHNLFGTHSLSPPLLLHSTYKSLLLQQRRSYCSSASEDHRRSKLSAELQNIIAQHSKGGEGADIVRVAEQLPPELVCDIEDQHGSLLAFFRSCPTVFKVTKKGIAHFAVSLVASPAPATPPSACNGSVPTDTKIEPESGQQRAPSAPVVTPPPHLQRLHHVVVKQLLPMLQQADTFVPVSSIPEQITSDVRAATGCYARLCARYSELFTMSPCHTYIAHASVTNAPPLHHFQQEPGAGEDLQQQRDQQQVSPSYDDSDEYSTLDSMSDIPLPLMHFGESVHTATPANPTLALLARYCPSSFYVPIEDIESVISPLKRKEGQLGNVSVLHALQGFEEEFDVRSYEDFIGSDSSNSGNNNSMTFVRYVGEYCAVPADTDPESLYFSDYDPRSSALTLHQAIAASTAATRHLLSPRPSNDNSAATATDEITPPVPAISVAELEKTVAAETLNACIPLQQLQHHGAMATRLPNGSSRSILSSGVLFARMLYFERLPHLFEVADVERGLVHLRMHQDSVSSPSSGGVTELSMSLQDSPCATVLRYLVLKITIPRTLQEVERMLPDAYVRLITLCFGSLRKFIECHRLYLFFRGGDTVWTHRLIDQNTSPTATATAQFDGKIDPDELASKLYDRLPADTAVAHNSFVPRLTPEEFFFIGGNRHSREFFERFPHLFACNDLLFSKGKAWVLSRAEVPPPPNGIPKAQTLRDALFQVAVYTCKGETEENVMNMITREARAVIKAYGGLRKVLKAFSQWFRTEPLPFTIFITYIADGMNSSADSTTSTTGRYNK